MERYWRMLIDSLLDPVNLYRQLRSHPHPWFGVLVAGVSQVALMLSMNTSGFQEPTPLQRPAEIPTGVLTMNQGMGQVLAFVVLILGIHAAARILGGRGRLAAGISALGMATTPALLMSPIYVLSVATGWYVLTIISLPLVFVWGVVLDILAIREVYQLSTGRAIFTLILSIFVLAMIGMGLGLLFSLLFLISAATG